VSDNEHDAARLGPMVRAVVAKTLQRPMRDADVDDGVNETLRRIVEGRARLRHGEAIAPWAAGIARHVAIDMLRARRRQGVGTEEVVDEVVDPAPSPEELVIRGDARDRVRQALLSLDEGPRRAIELFHVEGATYEEIAKRLNVPMGTVATWVSRGRKTLVDVLKKRGGDR
jgi:RNA polymerase sigma factor (sigma-70 family)